MEPKIARIGRPLRIRVVVSVRNETCQHIIVNLHAKKRRYFFENHAQLSQRRSTINYCNTKCLYESDDGYAFVELASTRKHE